LGFRVNETVKNGTKVTCSLTMLVNVTKEIESALG